ncbi:MAG: hypothetical protein GY702_23040 [Desulfobulbaceae bacterium]|nr:hypothetical protein [Desulfobulbaceae bacterium]
MKKAKYFGGIITSFLLIILGAYSFSGRVWHFRSGNLASEKEAMFFGGFIATVGIVLLVIQLVSRNHGK